MSVELNPNAKKKNNGTRVFIGKLWINKVKNGNSEFNGKTYLSGSLDNDFIKLEIMAGDTIQIWPNNKRDGKKDADLRISIITENKDLIEAAQSVGSAKKVDGIGPKNQTEDDTIDALAEMTE